MAALEVVEIRTLDGANIFLPRPAIKIQLRADPAPPPAALAAARGRCAAWLRAAPLPGQPGAEPEPGVAGLVWSVATALHAALPLPAPAGGVFAADGRPVADPPPCAPGGVVVAFDWAWRSCAEGLARQAVAAVEAALAGRAFDAGGALGALREALARDRERGDRPLWVRDADRRIPIVSITGTNGKTTTTRCLVHLLTAAGRRVGTANSSGVWIGAEQVLEGDYTGPAGARRVLEDPAVEVAVLETARGGILLRGVAYESNDVGVVTNVSADHLGLQGIETVEQLAGVKGLVVRLTRPEGRAVLNADDPLITALAGQVRAPVTLFGRDPEGAAIRAHLAGGGRALLATGGWIVLAEGGSRTPLVALDDVPMTFGGRASHMVENALAAAAAALGCGLDPPAVARGLASFRNSPEQNFGRLNVFTLREPACTAIVDYAHNEAGLAHLLAFAGHYRRAGGRLIAIVGTAGDRPDATLRGLGRLAGAGADLVWIKETARYLRGRTPAEMNALFAAGVDAARPAPGQYTIAPDELTALTGALAAAREGDAIAMMCLEQQAEVLALLAERGA